MTTTESIETANKITVESLLYGYFRLYILPNASSTEVPLKVFNILLSSLICTHISSCYMLKFTLNILKKYDNWVNIEKKSKQSFVYDIPHQLERKEEVYVTASGTPFTEDIAAYQSAVYANIQPTNVINKTHKTITPKLNKYFQHISNLHGLTYKDYDTLHTYCSDQLFNNCNNTDTHECIPATCQVLNEEQKTELEKLSFQLMDASGISATSGGALGKSSSMESNDFSIQSNSMAIHPLQFEQNSIVTCKENYSEDSTSPTSVLALTAEAQDTFEPLPKTTFTSSGHSKINSSVASFLAPNWNSKNKTSNMSLRSKWQNHVTAASSADVSQFISQLSVLSLLPTISDTENSELTQDSDGIVMPSPTPPSLTISVKSYKFLFAGINTPDSNSNIGFREVSEMSVNPFDLLPQISEIDTGESDGKAAKKIQKWKYEFETKLTNILSEMDLMGDGVLDMADFSTALMSVIKDDLYDFMSISMEMFDSQELVKDDMDSAKIGDIVAMLMDCENNTDIIALRELLCKEFKIEISDDIEEENSDEKDLQDLVVKDLEKTDTPYKPIYQVTSGIQKFGKSKENKKENKVKKQSNEQNDKNNKIGHSKKLTITKSVTDNELTHVLDRIHIFLFHAVHDVQQIPL